MTFAPSASATCWPVEVSASSSALSSASSQAIVAAAWFVVGVTVTSSTAFATDTA